MSEDPKRKVPPRDVGFFRQLIEQVRLSYALFMDSRVPALLKIIPIGMLAYVISPIDLAPDVLPFIGQIDDIGLFLTAVTMFNNLAPAEVVEEHIKRLRTTSKIRFGQRGDEKIIDVKAEHPEAKKD